MASYQGPFVARWMDGREEQITGNAPSDDALSDIWEPARRRGAVELLQVREDGTRLVVDYSYREGMLPPKGARVRHKRHPQLTGVVQGYEYKSGERTPSDANLSALPLRVYWDQEIAHDVLGWFAIYPAPESLEVIADG